MESTFSFTRRHIVKYLYLELASHGYGMCFTSHPVLWPYPCLLNANKYVTLHSVPFTFHSLDLLFISLDLIIIIARHTNKFNKAKFSHNHWVIFHQALKKLVT